MKKLLIGLALISLFSCKEKCVECYVVTYDSPKPQGKMYLIEYCGTSKEIKHFQSNTNSKQKIVCQ